MSDENIDRTKCPHGLRWMACKDKECIKELDRLEDAATCPHGFMVGCPTCAPPEGFGGQPLIYSD